MKYVVWSLVLLLVILHHDYWFWHNPRLVFGFLPVGMFYHLCLSLGAALTWFLATRWAWPRDLEALEVEADAMEVSR